MYKRQVVDQLQGAVDGSVVPAEVVLVQMAVKVMELEQPIKDMLVVLL